jgi:hypothetical protein
METINNAILTAMQRYWDKEITQEELSAQYKGKFTSADLATALQTALSAGDATAVESIFHMGFTQDLFDGSTVPVLCQYLTETWHRQHEDIARLLQGLKDPRSIQPLADAMHIHCDYWIDGGDAFIRKCAYAIADIGTPEAKAKLQLLAKDSNAIVKKYALHHLGKA